MHLGKNLNGSTFTKEATERAIQSLANTPILSFIEENTNGELDYSDHRAIIHRKEDGDINVKYMGQAVGLIPETNNAKWETRVSDYGEELEYLTVEGLMWTKWDDPIDIIQRKGITSQSMELAEEHTGHWDEEGSYVFDDFKFFGACLLGNGVIPAMQNSTVELQFSTNKNMQDIIANKLKEFNTLFSSEKSSKETGGQIVTKDKQSKQETEVLNFELTHQQLSAKLRQNLETHRFVDKEGESARRYWYQDHTNTKVIYEDLAEAGQLYESPYTVNGNDVTVDLNDKVQASLAFIPDNRRKRDDDYSLTEELEKAQTKLAEFEATLTAKDTEVEETIESLKAKHTEEFEALKAEYAQTVEALKGDLATLAEKSTEFEAISTEVEELRTFKRTTELAQVKEKFSSKLDEKSLDAILEASADKTLDVLESEIFAEIGKQNFSLIQDEKSPKPIEIPFSKQTNTQDDGYNGLFNQFATKQ